MRLMKSPRQSKEDEFVERLRQRTLSPEVNRGSGPVEVRRLRVVRLPEGLEGTQSRDSECVDGWSQGVDC